MNNKAFTLIELLAVITILALLTLIAVPAISKQMDNSKETLYNNQLKNIEESARAWGADNLFKLPEGNDCITVTLGYLKDGGYIDTSVINPKTNDEFSNTNVFVNISKESNQYVYEVKTSGNKCELVDDDITN